MLGITGHAVHSDPSLAHLVTTPTLTYHYPLHFRDISLDIDWKEGEVGQWPLFFFLGKDLVLQKDAMPPVQRILLSSLVSVTCQ